MRHIPEAGAVCGSSARTDLRGGRGETSVPTATLLFVSADPDPADAVPVPYSGRSEAIEGLEQ